MLSSKNSVPFNKKLTFTGGIKNLLLASLAVQPSLNLNLIEDERKGLIKFEQS